MAQVVGIDSVITGLLVQTLASTILSLGKTLHSPCVMSCGGQWASVRLPRFSVPAVATMQFTMNE